jgi:hypothetical protein
MKPRLRPMKSCRKPSAEPKVYRTRLAVEWKKPYSSKAGVVVQLEMVRYGRL